MPGMFSTWYNNQYASWNRTRSLQAPPFVARVESRASRNATAMHNGTDVNPGGVGDVVINMGELGASPNAAGNNIPINKDNKDTLFGPSIGVVGNAPEWCTTDAELDEKIFKREKELNEKNDEDDGDVDELTPEIVKEWVCRSKEPAVPTTTLQALVNLKRPSIRLSPLAASSSDFSSSNVDQSSDAQAKHHQQHGLEFEFDCDAPMCAIALHVVGVPSHLSESEDLQQSDKSTADLHASTDGKESERLLLFEATLPGGFGRKLTLAEGAILELARLEAAARAHRAQLAAAAASTDGPKDSAEGSTANGPAAAGNNQVPEHHKKRFHFFRKRGNAATGLSSSANPSSSLAPAPALPAGPALAVVDAEASPHPQIPATGLSAQSQNTLSTFFAGGEVERARRKKEAEEEGVRVAIRLVARDAEGKSMRVRNEQVTYLHIVRQSSPHSITVSSGGGASGSGAENPNITEQKANEEEEKEEDDTRPWVVKVVKREARIGGHAFQLHEIYGLTAHASVSDGAAHSVTPSVPADSHTYPPQSGQPELPLLNGSGAAAEDDSAAECLLCLSAPREVVLLPCRHLVACRECAVNMVEFGAGGTVAQPEAEAPGATAGNGSGGETIGDGTAGVGAQGEIAITTSPTPAPAPAPTSRRKRKAKGWFCPVCRQPYTSLLRITTAPPPSKGIGLGHTGASDGAGDAKRVSLASSVDADSASSSASSPVQQVPTHPLAPTPELATSGGGAEGRGDGNDGSTTTASTDGQTQMSTPTRGAFSSIARPGFLRGFSARAVRERDLERGT